MKVKLIKNPSKHYYLIIDKVPQFAYITEPLTGGYIIASSSESELFKLSLKNCQAIERVYDLEELGKEFAKTKSSHSTFQDTHKRDFIEGFQRALELMGDKKFSEEDIKNAIEYGIQSVLQAIPGVTSTQGILDSYKQSLQQTEWDVEIEVECVMGCQNFLLNGEKSVCCGDKKPKLDEDGCLILKRK